MNVELFIIGLFSLVLIMGHLTKFPNKIINWLLPVLSIYSFLGYCLYLIHSFANEYYRYIYEDERQFRLLFITSCFFIIYLASNLVYAINERKLNLIFTFWFVTIVVNIYILFYNPYYFSNYTGWIYFFCYLLQFILNVYSLIFIFFHLRK